jgi:CDP-4-dehydro-6-deoxyglucose reductase
VFDHNENTRSLFLRLPSTSRLTFKAGQFLSFLLPVADQVLTRPYSIASDPTNNELLEICFNLVPGGEGSTYLFTRKKGEVLRFTGPWGTFILDHPPQTECVFIAEGTGIAPIRPMIKHALSYRLKESLRLLYAAEREENFLYWTEFDVWTQHYPQFRYDLIMLNPSSGWRGLRGTLLQEVERCYVRSDNERNRLFFICGIGNQVTILRDILRRNGYERRAVQYEKW